MIIRIFILLFLEVMRFFAEFFGDVFSRCYAVFFLGRVNGLLVRLRKFFFFFGSPGRLEISIHCSVP